MNSKAKEIIDNAVKELVTDIGNGYSDRIVKFLEFKARFHKYSLSNAILIQLQKETAQFVKGFVQWKNMGYHVNAGAKGIMILAPAPIKYIEREYEDRTERIFFRNMTELERKRTKDHEIMSWFKDVYVYDIADTNCKEYPTFFYDLGNSEEELFGHVINVAIGKNIEINYVKDTRSEGSFNILSKSITLKTQSFNNMLLTLIHELAHYLCHERKDYKTTYSEGEIHAESIAFIVSKFLGISNPFSKDYIINWKGSIDKIHEHLELIDQVASEFITLIEGTEDMNESNKQLYETAKA